MDYMGLVYRFWKRRCMLKWGLDTTVLNAPLDFAAKKGTVVLANYATFVAL
jgi:hypothetical protein